MIVQFCKYFFKFLLNLMHIFEKLPKILVLCPIVKFRSTVEKSDPQTIYGPPSTEKSCINYCIDTQEKSITFQKILEKSQNCK